MKILFLTKYDSMGASSRYRFFQFYDFYRKNGFEIETKAFFSDDYLLDLYTGNINPFIVLKSYWKRFLTLFVINNYDLLIIESELFPYFPAFFEKLIKLFNIKYVVDYDDAIFHRYDKHKNSLVRLILSNKIAKVMEYSSLVVVGNNYLANYARTRTTVKTVVVPTVIDLDKYDSVTIPEKSTDEIVIGWIGSPSTLKYLCFLENVFIELSKKYKIKVHIIGTSISPFDNLDVNLISWSEVTEISELKRFDIGIMPLIDSPWERGKCGFKLIQYMGCSLPVLGSPVGVNSEIVEDGKNGFLVTSEEEWKNSLELLIQEQQLRGQFGKEGRNKVAQNYSKNAVQNKLLKLYMETIYKCVE